MKEIHTLIYDLIDIGVNFRPMYLLLLLLFSSSIVAINLMISCCLCKMFYLLSKIHFSCSASCIRGKNVDVYVDNLTSCSR